MLGLKDLELHDACVKKMNVDYISKTVSIDLDFYENSNSCDRQSGSIIFEGIESISQICDFNRLSHHFDAGNVNYWVPAQRGGTTYIYLTDGCIAITAKKIKINGVNAVRQWDGLLPIGIKVPY
jgi:hypothetical protein